MVYRSAPSAEPREIVGDVLLAVDASGPAGARGADGARGSDGAGSGGDGQPGAPAGAAARGEDGGTVAITLEGDGSGGLRVRGTRARSDGSRAAVDERLPIGEHGFVDVTARGGHGGDGGHGGRGGDGATGSRGRDATRYSSGTNGGRGGDGGDGGRGSSGADGGAGGHVVVRVDDADTHLLMLVRSGVEGGRGGKPGSHGAGGHGGPGGQGGSSHSWTETEHYTDSQGKSQTRTRWHSNPGGSDGPSGRDGRSASGPLYAGRDGAVGSFAIEVATERGLATYPMRYHLELAGIALETDDRDGVFEPGETVRVRALRVRNVGGMPTPRTRAITLEVRDGRWARELPDQSIEVPRSLPAGTEVEVPAELSLEIRDHAPADPADPLLDRERVSLRAHVPDVARSFEGFEQSDTAEAATMTVRFPAACSVLQGLVSLAPGEVTRLRYVIRNQSKRGLGSRSETKRRLRARLVLHESELDDRHAVMFDERGAAVAMGGDGLVREIELLEAGDDWIFEGAIGLREGAPAYRELRIRLTLEIGRLDDPYTLRVVQHRELRVRCARPLTPGGRADWLLVTHHRTSREEVDAWEALAKREERSLAVWDLSLHGQLSLESEREDGPPMLERLAGGLVIVPGHPLQTVAGEARPHTFLSPATLARAAASGVDVLLAGAEPPLAALLMPEHAESGVAPADGERALIERIAARRDDGDAFVEEAELHEVGFFFEDARAARLELRARSLAERLARRFPLRRFVVVWDHAPAPRAHFGLVKRTRLGTVGVLARPAARSGLAHVAADDELVRDPRFVLGDRCASAIALASGPDDQLEGLARAIAAGDVARARRWADAIACGIAAEQAAVLRRTRARAGLGRDAMREALPRLARLAHSPLLAGHDPRGHGAGVLVALAARVLVFADAQPVWWERVPGIAWSRRAAGLDALTEEMIDAFLEVQGDDEVRRVLRGRLKSEVRALRDAWKAARREGRRDRAAWARTLAMGAIESDGVTTDDELVVADAGTVIERSEWDAHVGRARAHGESIAELVAATGDERRALLVAETCEVLLARAQDDAVEDRAALRAAATAR